MRKTTVNDIIAHIRMCAPIDDRQCTKFPIKRFSYDTVEQAINQLHQQGLYLDLEPFDLRGTCQLWRSDGDIHYGLARKATKKLVKKLEELHPEKSRLEILTEISQKEFKGVPVNRYNTTIAGVLSVYGGSPYAAIKDFVEHDYAFRWFSDLQPYDMRSAPKKTWLNGSKNFVLARSLTDKLLQKLQEKGKPLEQVLPEISLETFRTVPINKFGTVLETMLVLVYGNSAYRALRDLIDNDPKYAEYRDFQPFDIKFAPQNTWKNRSWRNLKLARQATKLLLSKLLESGEPMERVLSKLYRNVFYNLPIDRYGATLESMLLHVYECSPYDAVKDLFDHDDSFKEFRDFKPFDMQRSPQHTWVRPDGSKNFKLAREAMRQLFSKLQELNPGKSDEEIISAVTRDVFYDVEINNYGTILSGMFTRVFNNSPYRAFKDFVQNNKKYAHLLPAVEKLKHSV